MRRGQIVAAMAALLGVIGCHKVEPQAPGQELTIAAVNGDVATVSRILQTVDPDALNVQGTTALAEAERARQAEVIKVLIEHGATGNPKTHDPEFAILAAATRCDADTIKMALAKFKDRDLEGNLSASALTTIAVNGRAKELDALLPSVPIGKVQPHAFTILLNALTAPRMGVDRDWSCLKILLRAGLNPNAKDRSGMPILQESVDYGPKPVSLLLEAGADPHVEAHGDPEVKKLLMRHRQKRPSRSKQF